MASSYWETVESIAREAIEENGTDEQSWHDYIHESVDGSSFIIYYGENETVLEETKNEPDNEEVASMADPKGDWKQMRMTAAYLAMTADVFQEAQSLVDEYTAHYFKVKVGENFAMKSDLPDFDDEEDDEEAVFHTKREAEDAAESYKDANIGAEVVAFNDSDEVINMDIDLID